MSDKFEKPAPPANDPFGDDPKAEVGKTPDAAKAKDSAKADDRAAAKAAPKVVTASHYVVLFAGVARPTVPIVDPKTGDVTGHRTGGDHWAKGDLIPAEDLPDDDRLRLLAMGAIAPKFGGDVPDASNLS
jgi:hypothetical protein